MKVNVGGRLARLARVVDLDDQVDATRRVFASDTRWTVSRGSDLEEGPSQGLPAWSPHVGDPILKSNRTRGVDFTLFMVDALTNDDLIHQAGSSDPRPRDAVGARTRRGAIVRRRRAMSENSMSDRPIGVICAVAWRSSPAGTVACAVVNGHRA
jgi:hypothetical protein